MSKKFYLVEETLNVNGNEVANYFKFRYLDESQRPEDINLTTDDWHELVKIAVDPEYQKEMDLEMTPPSLLHSYYIKSWNLNKRFYKVEFRYLTHIRKVQVADLSTMSSEDIISRMPKDEFELLQIEMLRFIWEAVAERYCSPELIQCMCFAPFQKDYKKMSPEEFRRFGRMLRQSIQTTR